MYIIDRTANPKGKSIPNTQRFLNRVRNQIKASIADIIKKASLDEVVGGADNKIRVSGGALHEPSFHIDTSNSDWTSVLTGNKKQENEAFYYAPQANIPSLRSWVLNYIEKDKIPKPYEGEGGNGSGGSSSGSGIDDFIFNLDRKEWDEYLWDELELPNQDDTKSILSIPTWKKNGFQHDGAPSNLALTRTVKNSYARRIAFHRPKDEELQELLAQVDKAETPQELARLMDLVEEMQRRMTVIPWIDPIDLRYHDYRKEMRPKFNAAMFCLMDVSGSMSEEMKDLAKRFYIFLYSFLKTKYEKVEVIFIRHTHEAKECDEQTFFYDPETGGTVVSSALELMANIIKERFPLCDWNIYGAQCSDGDNYSSDNELVKNLMHSYLLSTVQHFVYVEVGRGNMMMWGSVAPHKSQLWATYETIKESHGNIFDMTKIRNKGDVYPAMISLYSKHKDKSHANH